MIIKKEQKHILKSIENLADYVDTMYSLTQATAHWYMFSMFLVLLILSPKIMVADLNYADFLSINVNLPTDSKEMNPQWSQNKVLYISVTLGNTECRKRQLKDTSCSHSWQPVFRMILVL